jgi:hypothetical protein
MDIERILREIDAEKDKLERIRAILDGFSRTVKRKQTRTKRVEQQIALAVDHLPEPRLIVLPPKQRPQFTRRIKPRVTEPTALSTPASTKPVFVPNIPKPDGKPRIEDSRVGESGLEAIMRQKLLGGAA